MTTNKAAPQSQGHHFGSCLCRAKFFRRPLFFLLCDVILSGIVPLLPSDERVAVPILGLHGFCVACIALAEFIIICQRAYFIAGLLSELFGIMKWPFFFSIVHLLFIPMSWVVRTLLLSDEAAMDLFAAPSFVAVFVLHIIFALQYFFSILFVFFRFADPQLYVPAQLS